MFSEILMYIDQAVSKINLAVLFPPWMTQTLRREKKAVLTKAIASHLHKYLHGRVIFICMAEHKYAKYVKYLINAF